MLVLLVTCGIVIVVIAGRHTWRGILVARIACWAGHAGSAALARMSAEPRLIGMFLADPAAVIAFHSEISRRIM
jgi:hypothetical protein